jgi:hypothetical protein
MAYNTVATLAAGHFNWHKAHSDTEMSSQHESESQITCILNNSDKSMVKLRKATAVPQSIAGSETGIRMRYLPISKSVC